jgi:5-carboxymethyl-2-hydroxymuconate isomerase
VDKVMGEGEETEKRRERVRKLAEMAKKAIEEGGSSYLNITLLLEDIMPQGKKKKKKERLRLRDYLSWLYFLIVWSLKK